MTKAMIEEIDKIDNIEELTEVYEYVKKIWQSCMVDERVIAAIGLRKGDKVIFQHPSTKEDTKGEIASVSRTHCIIATSDAYIRVPANLIRKES